MLSVHEVDNCRVIDGKAVVLLNSNAAIIQLNPHLIDLSEVFAFQKQSSANGQL